MLDRLYLPLLGLAAIGVIALASVFPQALGDRSPAPFGHTPVLQTPERKAAMQRATEASERRIKDARDAVRNLQDQALSPKQ